MNIGQAGFEATKNPKRCGWRVDYLRQLGSSLILLVIMVLGRQAQADSMSVSETWKDNSIVSSSDSGTFSASLTIPGLQNFTTAMWSNLLISVNTSNMNTAGFADIMGNANTNFYSSGSSFSGTSAIFVYQAPWSDTNGNFVNAFKLTFSRSGNVLTISGQTQNPSSLQPPWSIVAVNYLFTRGATNDPDICEVILLNNGSPYADIIRTIPITAVNTETLDAQSNILNNVTASGSADFTPPTLTAVNPSSTTLTTTNGLLPVVVKATDASGIANVEYYVNGQDFGPGIAGVSNLWSQNLALSPGVTTIKEVATDNQFNVSTNTLTVTYANGMTNASLITFSEHWLDSYITNSGGVGSLTQDAGVLDAALPVPALQAMSATTWSNLFLVVTFGGIQLTQSLTAANILTTNSATFQLFTNDLSANPVLAEQLTITRVGGKLLVAAETANPAYAQPMPVIADSYLYEPGVVDDQQPFTLTLIDGTTSIPYFNLTHTVYITGTNTFTVTNGVPLNNIQIAGAADFTPPTITALSPATSTITTTNALLNVTVKATDAYGISNLDFMVNGVLLNFASLELTNIWNSSGSSNAWSFTVALLPGSNLVQAVATDPSGNIATNSLTANYIDVQTNANSITLSENYWHPPFVQNPQHDAGVVNAALLVPALQTMTADTWSNLNVYVDIGSLPFSANMSTANILTSNNAVFFLNSGLGINNPGQALRISRVGAKLILVLEDISSFSFATSIFANEYNMGGIGNISIQQPFTLQLTDGGNSTQYLNLSRTIYVTGTDTLSSYEFVELTGSADYISPTNQITAPIMGEQWSNSTFVATGKALDNIGVANVVYSINGSDWAPVSTGNAFINWSVPVNLNAGSNSFSTYAYDFDNNYSTTNTVSFRYIPSSTIALSTNGLGTLSPNYAGAMLGISNTYSITASPASGFVFSNWSGSTNVNSATLTFQMQSNLSFTVNFVDVTRPTLSITNLTAGQQISNAAFTVRGVAADNWKVTDVLYQLNGGGWNNASTVNNWTNWNAPLNLVPGTNTLQVFAQDQGGNNSLTNTVNFAYILSSRLQIQLNGVGTLSPNYSNALLAIGQNYNITATPGSGFVFTNWTVSTNWVGGRIVNTASLPFTMASNLTLQANLVDVTRPTLTITTPTANQRMTNALAYVIGTAGDNWKVAGVWYQFNNGLWTIAPTTNNWTNWNSTLTLPAGTNSLSAYALDLGGNYSLTSSVSFFSSNTFQLQLAFDTNTPLVVNGLHFDLLVSTNLRGHVQYSTNLLNWATLTNFNGTNSMLKFNDSAATNAAQRFYRAVIP